MFGIGYTEIAIIAVVLLLLFGGRLPEMMKSLGKSIPSFQRGIAEAKQEIKDMERDIKEVEKGLTNAAKS